MVPNLRLTIVLNPSRPATPVGRLVCFLSPLARRGMHFALGVTPYEAPH